mgnify:CR=1 FL=1
MLFKGCAAHTRLIFGKEIGFNHIDLYVCLF